MSAERTPRPAETPDYYYPRPAHYQPKKMLRWCGGLLHFLEKIEKSAFAERSSRGSAAHERTSAGAPTGDKTDSARQPGPAPRASARTPVPPRRRWVPPSSLRHHEVPDGDAKHDIIFRKVRGILNKLTPEKFQKLSDDLLGLELDSDKVLKGVILLIFEKALDEPKYSSMYAQLCKRLSEEAPNFEPEGQPCTFKLLLLNKCRTEFENRAQAFAAYEERASLPPEDEEKRHLAKRKMLGNIKFIGELGKLEILAESILHRCIQNLLARRAAAEHHEDLECLAQLVRTCGRVLDSERGRRLMDQYFARIDTLSASRELAPRIRFMLRDVGELRRGGWTPRAAVSHEGPVPIHQLRDDDEPPRRERERDALFRGGLRARPLDDVLAGLGLQPAAPLQPDKLFGELRRYPPRGERADRDRERGDRERDRRAPPPREGSRASKRAPPPATLHDVQMRPAANSLVFTANRLSRAPAPAPLAPAPPPAFAGAHAPPAPPPGERAPLAIKPAPDKTKPKKDKGVDKEEACRLALAAAEALEASAPPPEERAPDAEPPPAEPLRRLVALQLPDKALRRAIAGVLERALAADAEAAPWAACAVVRAVKRAPQHEAARALLQRHPHARLPRLLAHMVRARLVPLAELGAWCEHGAHHPLLLEVLQELHAALGAERLVRALDDAKINLAAYAAAHAEPAVGGEDGAGDGGERALAALEARGLGALVPQLRVRAALARQLAGEPAPGALYRWIKAHVEPPVRGSPAFVSALVGLVLAAVTRAAGSHAPDADKAALEREKALLEAYAPLLTAVVARRGDLQLAAVYAAQVHAHHHRYPKGMLLRWFMYLYNLEVCEEDAFLRWREDVTDAYPGKGEALFQVNTWLTWLQQQESEEEEGED